MKITAVFLGLLAGVFSLISNAHAQAVGFSGVATFKAEWTTSGAVSTVKSSVSVSEILNVQYQTFAGKVVFALAGQPYKYGDTRLRVTTAASSRSFILRPYSSLKKLNFSGTVRVAAGVHYPMLLITDLSGKAFYSVLPFPKSFNTRLGRKSAGPVGSRNAISYSAAESDTSPGSGLLVLK